MHVPAALCTIHNFIQIHNPEKGPVPNDNPVDGDGGNNEGSGHNLEPIEDEGLEEECTLRDQIADQMWEDYIVIRQECELDDDDDNSDIFDRFSKINDIMM